MKNNKSIRGKDLLLNIIEKSSNILDNLIEVHQIIFSQKLGQKIDYENLLAATTQAREVYTASLELISEKNRFKAIEELDLNLVHVYTNSLLIYAESLHKMLTCLREKSEGGKYGWLAYRRDLKKYNGSMSAYMSIADLVSVVYVKYKKS